MATDTGDERTPLLRPGDDNTGIQHNNVNIGVTTSSPVVPPTERLLVLGLSFSLLIVLTIGTTLYNTAILDIQEGIICRRIHGPNIDNGNCKDAKVQSELSTIRGWDNSFSLLVSLIASVPYGAIADSHGRRLVFGLSLLGLTLDAAFGSLVCAMPDVFHPGAIWLGNLFLVVGGGEAIFMAMAYTIVADVTDEAQRATSFFYLGAALMSGSLIANPIVFFAMKHGPWFSLVMGLSGLTMAIPIAFAIPETLSHKTSIQDPTTAANSTTPQETATKVLTSTLRSARFLFWEHALVGFLLISLALEIFGRSVVLQLLQYASHRYDMPFSEAGLLHSVIALISLVLLLAGLPWASQFLLDKVGLSAREKDLRLVQGSAVLAAAGTLLQGLAETRTALVGGIVLAVMGGGYTFMIRGLMTSLVGGREIGLMNTSIAFIEILAALVSGPVYARLYNVGLKWGDEWSGLPFIFAGLVMVAAAVLVGAIRGSMILHEWKEDEDEDESGV